MEAQLAEQEEALDAEVARLEEEKAQHDGELAAKEEELNALAE